MKEAREVFGGGLGRGFTIIHGYLLNVDTPIGCKLVKSPLRCAHYCLTKRDCVSFNYNRESRYCELSDYQLTDVAQLKSGAVSVDENSVNILGTATRNTEKSFYVLTNNG